jgi:peroxiredoxin
LAWSPYKAEPIELTDTAGNPWRLADQKGKKVLVLFYLGGKCAHCMQQLENFGKEVEAFKKMGVEVVAVSTDDASATKALKDNADGIKFPMPLLADPKLATFQAYRCFDDFEKSPLHGTFLIDADGAVRFQRISADPFLDVEFTKTEAARLDKLR